VSLRYQINLRVLLSALCILILGSTVTIWQARNAVNNEVESSINLALQWVELSLGYKTIANYSTQIKKKLSVNSVAELAHIAVLYDMVNH